MTKIEKPGAARLKPCPDTNPVFLLAHRGSVPFTLWERRLMLIPTKSWAYVDGGTLVA
jgi:hypothetical protein